MTREEANDILSMRKLGLGRFGQSTINAALVATGDLVVLTSLNPQEEAPRSDHPVANSQIRVWRSPVAGGNSSVRA